VEAARLSPQRNQRSNFECSGVQSSRLGAAQRSGRPSAGPDWVQSSGDRDLRHNWPELWQFLP